MAKGTRNKRDTPAFKEKAAGPLTAEHQRLRAEAVCLKNLQITPNESLQNSKLPIKMLQQSGA